MKKTKINNRDYGLDMMRILMTLFVIAIHILNKGGAYSACYADENIFKSGLALELEFAVSCAVNGFALISGYVGCRSKFKISRILWLYFTVSFYNAVIPLVFHFLRGYTIDKVVILRAILPFAYDANWYFTAYLGMFFLIPFMNLGIKYLDKKQCITAIAAIMILFSVIPTLLYMFVTESYDYNIFKISAGYSPLWLAILYIVGAAIREHDLFRKVPRIMGLIVYLLSTIIGASIASLGTICPEEALDTYYSPLIIAQAIGLLLFFRELKMPGFVCKIVDFLAPHSFNIYIIHTQDAVWIMWLAGRYSSRASECSPLLFPIMFVFYTVSIYGLCLIVDMPLYYSIKFFNRIFRKSGSSAAQTQKEKINV
ncbi:MAG: acyltransferase family protein [Ruminococcus sp.]|nr:acyltransferase family protein [Ruminococcus sp.]